MGKAQRLRLQDVRAIYRLVGECRELGADSRTWRQHALTRLRVLVDAMVGVGGELAAPFSPSNQAILQVVDVGWDSQKARHFHLAYHRSQAMAHDPFIRQFSRLPGRFNTRSPEQLINMRHWHASKAFNDYIRPAGVDAGLFSQQGLDTGTFNTLSFHRVLGAPLFTRRERRLVHLFHQEIGPLIGRALSSAREPSLTDLAPRVRQTLGCLLEGDSEKQVAARLDLSRTTVHEYIGTLYRHFGVTSRAELMAYFLRRLRGTNRT
jgi:DNA-binding CsgD family transcriptional regulator